MSRVRWMVAVGPAAMALALCLSGANCTDGGSGVDGGKETGAATDARFDGPVRDGSAVSDASDAGNARGDECAYQRYIAYNAEWMGQLIMPCTNHPGDGGTWTGSILFSRAEANGSTSQDAADWHALPPSLQSYCAYTWSSDAAPPDVSEISLVAKAAVAPDYAVVSPIESFKATGCDEIANQGAVSACSALWSTAQVATELPDAGADAKAQVTEIVVIDTTPTGEAPDLNTASPHGTAVGAVAQRVACAGGSCANVRYQLAMPRQGCVRNYDAGGDFGSLGEIAVAVWAAHDAPSNARVLNLSLGWTPLQDAGGGLAIDDAGATLSSAESAVLDALRYANCQGDIILAAAGNKANAGSPEEGPLYPAAWEALPAPANCASYRDAGAPASPDASYAPLVYAVGGVDFEDRPLANARPEGRPRLAAYGSAVTVPLDPQSSRYSPIMTGSSMATATASGVAAATWSLMSGFSPADTMAIVYATGASLDAAAEFPTFPTPQPIHRLSLCRALEKACMFGACASAPLCDLNASAPQIPTDWSGLTLVAASVCTDAAACPLDSSVQNSIDEPWGFPQPNGEGCTTCVLFNQAGRLVFDAVLAAPLTGPALLELTDGNGNTIVFRLAVDADAGVSDDGGAPIAFSADLGPESLAPVAATLSLVSAATYDPVLIVPTP